MQHPHLQEHIDLIARHEQEFHNDQELAALKEDTAIDEVAEHIRESLPVED